MSICIVFVSLFRMGICNKTQKQMLVYVFLRNDTIIIYSFLKSDTLTYIRNMKKAWVDDTLLFI